MDGCFKWLIILIIILIILSIVLPLLIGGGRVYISAYDDCLFSRALAAKIKKIEQKGNFTQITIGIYLVDF